MPAGHPARYRGRTGAELRSVDRSRDEGLLDVTMPLIAWVRWADH
jgi:hypothetical protein